jgi:general secretion pathway protein G
MKTSLSRRRKGGFTLIEVLLVLVILVILGSLAVTAYGPIQDSARAKATLAQLGLFQTALSKYKLDLGFYPPVLESLWFAPSDDQGMWQGPYMDGQQEIADAWGTYFSYQLLDGGYTCQITSAGADRAFNTNDDIFKLYTN